MVHVVEGIAFGEEERRMRPTPRPTAKAMTTRRTHIEAATTIRGRLFNPCRLLVVGSGGPIVRCLDEECLSIFGSLRSSDPSNGARRLI